MERMQDAANVGALGMHRPDRAIKAGFQQLLGDILRPAAAEQGDGFWPQQAREITPRHVQAPKGRRSARLMMWRWISDVPSQMRSTRASRQMRSSGNSSINPIPPWI